MARQAIYQQSGSDSVATATTPGQPSKRKTSPPSPEVDASQAGEKSTMTAPPPGEGEGRLRPRRMAEMVGQADVIERLQIAIDAASGRGEPLGHILFDGPPGLGKTTFATVIPAEMNTTVQLANGAGLRAPKDLLPYLTNVSAKSVLFIDEIHRVPKAVEEFLYTAMEDFRIDIVLGEGVNARTINYNVEPFTLIGATTRAGMLSAPLRDRFQIREHLGWYTHGELAEIVQRNAKKLSIEIDDGSAAVIASRSRSTPRLANNRLLWVRDYSQSKADGRFDATITAAALDMIGIDKLGLDKQDRNYLKTLIRVFAGGPAGLDAIAHTMNVSSDTLEDEVEPFLLRSELLIRTRRGRLATPRAFEHLKLTAPPTSL